MNDSNFESLKLKNQLCFPLYAASREVIKQYRPYLDAINLTYTQYIAMMVFWEEKKISVKELGKKLFLDNGKHYYIGRNIDMCDLVVSNDTLISRVHCVICYDAKENIINIFDKSSNGIRLDTGESLNGGKAIIQRDSIIYLAGGKVALKCCLAQE